MKNKKAWIRIVEAFFAVLIIAGALLIVINQTDNSENEASEQVNKIMRFVLGEFRLNEAIRNAVEISIPPVNWEDNLFPPIIKEKLKEDVPNYMECQAKICSIDDTCELNEQVDKNVYAKSSLLTEGESTKKIKLFCWMK
jgi:hypothetical protein